MNKPMDPKQALMRLEDLCARAEHCEGELYEKLRKWSIGAADADKIVCSLRERRFVDDARFCEAYVRDKIRFGRWGRRKIAMALAAKRVQREIIREALAGIDSDEYNEALQAVLAAKILQLGGIEALSDYEARQRVFRFALQRGFESTMIAAAIRGLMAR